MLTRDMCNQYVDTPLPSHALKVCLGALRVIVKALRGVGEEERAKIEGEKGEKGEKGEGHEAASGLRKESASESEDGSNGSHIQLRAGSSAKQPESPSTPPYPVSWSSRAVKQKPVTPLKLEDLLPLFMPDRGCVLHTSFSLTVDDAPWISSALSQGKSTVKFAHPGIDPSDSLLLGAKSLRGLLFSGDDITCPHPVRLRELLLNDTVKEVIRDFAALADNLDANSIHILYDQRVHPSESLMHPGLAPTQGPSLVVYIEGPALKAEDVCRLLVPPDILPPIIDEEKKSRGYLGANYDHLTSSSTHGGEEGNVGKELRQYPRCGGKRLSSAFAVTDCLQVLTGREYIIFDPCGLYLIRGGEEGDKLQGTGQGQGSVQGQGQGRDQKPAGAGGKSQPQIPESDPRAQRCYVVGSQKSHIPTGGDEDVLTRFPDQFSPLLSLPFKVGDSLLGPHGIKGVLLRMVRDIFILNTTLLTSILFPSHHHHTHITHTTLLTHQTPYYSHCTAPSSKSVRALLHYHL